MLSLYGIFFNTDILICSAITLFLILLVYFLHKKCEIFSEGTSRQLIIFAYLSVLFGKVFNFYQFVPYWDKILHFLSGLILYHAGNDIYFKAGGNKNKLLRGIFALLFSVATAALWEIWEFAGDSIFHTNAQNNSLSDTMYDIIAGTSGAVFNTLYFFLFSR